jgi:hypothetical protein
MFCPQCAAEYEEWVTRCPDCKVDLVAEPPGNPASETDSAATTRDLELVTVFEATDPGLIALAKSLLAEAEVPFMTRNEALQDLFGFGRLSAVNPITGPVFFQVPIEYALDALLALHELRQK